ncbi:hypothetical protein MKW92_008680 [Papaver armeniacum]|nr:hypothetical protein MKW92_008680 [Papaver armeniacum]
MVETRRSSASSKRSLPATTSTTSSSSPSPNPPNKRSKASEGSSSQEEVPATSQQLATQGGSESHDEELRQSDPIVDQDAATKESTTAAPEPAAVEKSDVNGGNGEGPTDMEVEKSTKSAVATKRIPQRLQKSASKIPWGRLISQCSQNPHQHISGTQFSIGQSRTCNLWLRDPAVSPVLCRLKHVERGGSSVAQLEVVGERIFQQLKTESITSSALPSSLGLAEAHGLQFEARSRDPAVAGASILASLSNLRKDLSLLPPPTQTGEDAQQGLERPILPSGCEVPDDVETNSPVHKSGSENNDTDGVSVSEKDALLAADLPANESLNLDNLPTGARIDIEIGKVPGSNYDLRSLLRMLAASEFDLNGGIFKSLDEHRGLRDLFKDPDSTTLSATRSQAFKDSLQQGILSASDIEVSFDNFPYYLSETTKNVLVASTFINLKCNEFTKYTSDLPTISPRILLSGPPGSDIYQETLAKALAKHFGARLLVVDSLLLPGGQSPKDTESSKESSRSEKLVAVSKQRTSLVELPIPLKRPASSVEAEITGAFSSQTLPKQETSTASSKSYTFKTGDRVRYMGTPHSPGYPPLQPPSRGPSSGYRGKVVLAFEENGSSKIGVRFDKSIPDGNDLGGLCEEDHGFFCAADALRLDSSANDDVDKLAINELFEVNCYLSSE